MLVNDGLQIAELTRTWAGKWKHIQSVIEVCVLMRYTLLLVYLKSFLLTQEQNLALHSEGIKMTLASEKPHLLTIDDGTSTSGVVLYYLQVHVHCWSKSRLKKKKLHGRWKQGSWGDTGPPIFGCTLTFYGVYTLVSIQ